VERDVLEKTFKRAGTASIFSLTVGSGSPSMALVKQVQYHPTKGYIQHVDFLRVAARDKLRTRIPLRFTGEAPAARDPVLIVIRPLAEVTVECLPADLPPAVEVDQAPLEDVSSVIRVGDLNPGPNVTIVTDPNEVVASVTEVRAEPEPVVAEEEVAAEAEAAEQPEAEAAEPPEGGSAGDETEEDR
jgi:large subunit ribosomal protein L25